MAESLSAWEKLKELNIEIDVYNLRFVKPIDSKYLIDILASYSHVLLVEDGSVSGGVGTYISSIIIENNLNISYKHIGIPEKFLSQALRSALLKDCGLDGPGIAGTLIDITKEDLSEKSLPWTISLV